MKIVVEIDESLESNEFIIRCNKIDKTIQKIQELAVNLSVNSENFIFYKDDNEYYFPLSKILFFESSDNNKINAHTSDDMYQIKYKLYELEELLPNNFIRISKSTIVNINYIFSINKSITSSSLIQFNKSYKQAYISRFYYKDLKQKLSERGK
jgi:DNA-binding LytR/AlgR family response regulator